MNLFYPSHDIALGIGLKHFNPPKVALKLQEDLSAISDIWNKDSSSPIPWGWDYDMRSYINKEYGVKMKDLPSDEDLSLLRDLSSRATTVEIISYLKNINNYYNYLQVPYIIDSAEKLSSFIKSNKNFVLKTPWSSSGRGLSRSELIKEDVIVGHAISTIKKMGCIVAEPWYNKVQDFAMLFYVDKDKVQFIGYSLFDNDEAGTYRSGNLVSNDAIERYLLQYIDKRIIDDTKDTIIEKLNYLFAPFFGKPWEVGFIGIDMMIVKDNNSNKLHPCVEMNLRCTMGVVARLFFDKNLNSDNVGSFVITPALSANKLVDLDKKLFEKYHSKYCRLTTLRPESAFMAYVVLA